MTLESLHRLAEINQLLRSPDQTHQSNEDMSEVFIDILIPRTARVAKKGLLAFPRIDG